MKIISASRRTDIPAFYGDWFMKRISEGFSGCINPFNNKKYLVPTFNLYGCEKYMLPKLNVAPVHHTFFKADDI